MGLSSTPTSVLVHFKDTPAYGRPGLSPGLFLYNSIFIVGFMWTNKEKGKRVIVGGYSPRINDVDPEFLKTGAIIGVKGWAKVHPCDYWIGLDTGLIYKRDFDDKDARYKDYPKYVRDITAPKFLRKPNPSSETFVPSDFGIFFEKAHQGTVPTKWNKTLQFSNTTATAAISLAIVLGATEVVLVGVDFIGDTRADGSRYVKEDFWNPHLAAINNHLVRFQSFVKIYKTHPDSKLECPYMEVA